MLYKTPYFIVLANMVKTKEVKVLKNRNIAESAGYILVLDIFHFRIDELSHAGVVEAFKTVEWYILR